MPPGRYAPAYQPELTDEELAAAASPPEQAGTYYPPPQTAAPPVPEKTYAPVEPGMYSEPYPGPGSATETTPTPPWDWKSGTVEPGMYAPIYREPGQLARTYEPLEPGIYNETYIQPGGVTPRSASTYYGGPVWPPYNTGVAHPSASGKPRAGVFTSYPATGAPPTRRQIPSGGTQLPGYPMGPEVPSEPPMPGAASIGDIYGAMSGGQGSASPRAPVTLGTPATESYYRMLSHDPGVVATSRGKLISRRDLAPPVADSLKGLFGGGEQRSSQPMPLPPRPRRG
jgi:hypothetical protein